MTQNAKIYIIAAALTGSMLTGCAYTERPGMTTIDQSINEMTAQPLVPTTAMMPEKPHRKVGSLWQPGSRGFFRDNRATNVGDILTVLVTENAEANSEAKTETNRKDTNTAGVTNLLNAAGKLANRGMTLGAGGLVDTESDRDFEGEGKTDRKDTFTATIAATVTQVLPNGNLVIQGRRELVLNYGLQELMIQGIVRPEDISKNNTITSEKIAEARISYAGRGLVDETQTPQYGTRFLNKWMPF